MDTRTKGTLTGAGSGALTGAGAGAVAGPWGAAVGGVLGGAIGGIGGYFAGDSEQKNQEANADQMKMLQDFNRKAYAARQQNLSQIYSMYDPYVQAVNQYTGSNLKMPSANSGGYFGV
jgi:phage tail tape-measure protein